MHGYKQCLAHLCTHRCCRCNHVHRGACAVATAAAASALCTAAFASQPLQACTRSANRHARSPLRRSSSAAVHESFSTAHFRVHRATSRAHSREAPSTHATTQQSQIQGKKPQRRRGRSQGAHSPGPALLARRPRPLRTQVSLLCCLLLLVLRRLPVVPHSMCVLFSVRQRLLRSMQRIPTVHRSVAVLRERHLL
jgi:hypothetical protein